VSSDTFQQGNIRFSVDFILGGSFIIILTHKRERTGSILQSSDSARLGNIENALDKVCSLDGFYYEANETAQSLGYKVKREVGLSAQQVQAVLPEVVVPAPIDDKYLTLHYDRVIPLLVEAIKELRAEVATLKTQLKS